jgi:hypothetical protein
MEYIGKTERQTFDYLSVSVGFIQSGPDLQHPYILLIRQSFS